MCKKVLVQKCPQHLGRILSSCFRHWGKLQPSYRNVGFRRIGGSFFTIWVLIENGSTNCYHTVSSLLLQWYVVQLGGWWSSPLLTSTECGALFSCPSSLLLRLLTCIVIQTVPHDTLKDTASRTFSFDTKIEYFNCKREKFRSSQKFKKQRLLRIRNAWFENYI